MDTRLPPKRRTMSVEYVCYARYGKLVWHYEEEHFLVRDRCHVVLHGLIFRNTPLTLK